MHPHKFLLPESFLLKKSYIISQLSVPAAQYADQSPKGSIDEGIRELINDINEREGWVTTSSCAGRVAVFVEGLKRGRLGDGIGEEAVNGGETYGDWGKSTGTAKDEVEEEAHHIERGSRRADEKATGPESGHRQLKLASSGGKGEGGRWLFVSHEPVEIEEVPGRDFSLFLGMRKSEAALEGGRSFTEERLINFKFEPMILHVLTASLSDAQAVLSAALQAGFRESGALNLASATREAPMPMVAVRSAGLAFGSVVGRLDADGEGVCIVSDAYLEGLLAVANERFKENSRRITRFHDLLLSCVRAPMNIEIGERTRRDDWEDASVRRERKKAEGLKKSQEMRRETEGANM